MLLIAGETVLAGRLTPVGFFFFWMACLIFTCLAIVMALRDLSVTRQRMRDERRALFKSTLEDIARSAEARSKSPERDENNS